MKQLAEAWFGMVYILFLVVCVFVVRKRIQSVQKQQWCRNCSRYVPASASRIDMRTNILLSILTLGIWLIVWACTADLSSEVLRKCPACGEETQSAPDNQPVEPTQT
jgi:hypothetical protein